MTECEKCKEGGCRPDDSHIPGAANLNKRNCEKGANFVIIQSNADRVITNQDRAESVCRKCGEHAKWIGNCLGRESLLCDIHAEKFRYKNGNLPNDMWFCVSKKM